MAIEQSTRYPVPGTGSPSHTYPGPQNAVRLTPEASSQAQQANQRLQSLVPLYSGLLTDFRDRLTAAAEPYGGAGGIGRPAEEKHPVAPAALEPIYQLERIAQELAEVVSGFRQVSG